MTATHETKPSAWLVPSLVDFTNAKKVHFSRTKDCTLTDEELKAQLTGTVQWHAEIFSDGDGVIDRDGVKHFPVPLYRALKPNNVVQGREPALSAKRPSGTEGSA